MPTVAPVKELASARTQKWDDVLEIGCGACRGPESRRIERSAPGGKEGETKKAARDLEAARVDVSVRQTVAREVEDRPDNEGGDSRAGRGAGGRARGDVERNNHCMSVPDSDAGKRQASAEDRPARSARQGVSTHLFGASSRYQSVAGIPDEVVLKRDRDLVGRTWHPWVRRGLLGLLALVPVLALANVFGQGQRGVSATSSAATLTVNAPSKVRGGLLYTVSFTIAAHSDLKNATLILDPGWIDGMQVNSINPQPIREGSKDGKVVLGLGHVAAGRSVKYWIELQVDPTTVGSRSQNVELDDGSTKLLTEQRRLTVFP